MGRRKLQFIIEHSGTHKLHLTHHYYDWYCNGRRSQLSYVTAYYTIYGGLLSHPWFVFTIIHGSKKEVSR